MRPEKSEFIRIPVQRSDRRVFLVGYIETGDVRIRFSDGGFLEPGLFCYVQRVMRKTGAIQYDEDTVRLPDGSVKFVRGPVVIVAKKAGGGVSMRVNVDWTDTQGQRRKTSAELDAAVCDEINSRLRLMYANLDTFDGDAIDAVIPVERRGNGEERRSGARAAGGV